MSFSESQNQNHFIVADVHLRKRVGLFYHLFHAILYFRSVNRSTLDKKQEKLYQQNISVCSLGVPKIWDLVV